MTRCNVLACEQLTLLWFRVHVFGDFVLYPNITKESNQNNGQMARAIKMGCLGLATTTRQGTLLGEGQTLQQYN